MERIGSDQRQLDFAIALAMNAPLACHWESDDGAENCVSSVSFYASASPLLN